MSCFSEQTNKNDDDDDDDEGKTNFSRRLKQFDGLTWLTTTHFILQQIYATAN